MSGLGIGPILTRPSNWVQGVPEWLLPGSEMFFFGHGGLWRSPAYLHTRPPKWAAFGSALEAHFLAAWQRAWGGYHPLWLGLSEKFHLPKKIFFFTQAGLVCGCRRPSVDLQPATALPYQHQRPLGVLPPQKGPWKVRGSTTMCALSAFQASEMGLTGDVG